MRPEMLFPWGYARSVFSIDYKGLHKQGFRGLIFDIDNTLVHHGDDATREIEDLFRRLHKRGFKTVLLSDNDEERVLRFVKNIDTQWICDAGKPDPACCKRAVEMLGLPADEVLVIGDQMFKDILCANRAGLASILVHFIKQPSERWIGKRRYLEFLMLGVWKLTPYSRRLGPGKPRGPKKRKLFCEMNPFFYWISKEKEILRRRLRDLKGNARFAKKQSDQKLPCLLAEHKSILIKTGKGIDPVLQHNKAVNLNIACKSLNGLVIRPGETFSFWHRVGNPSKSRGYKDGRVIIGGKMIPGVGGGLCNLGNTIHWLILHSPLTVKEVHFHSDALAPDHGPREPLSAGTAVSYNYIDFRFKNETDQNFQLCLWCDDTYLHGELRSQHELTDSYEIVEDDHHFHKEGDKYYRISKIFIESRNKADGSVTGRRLVRDNHSEVMFDISQIPKDAIR